MTTLQDAARNQFEVNKLARRQVNQQAAMRAHEKGGLGSSSSSTATTPSQPQFGPRLGEIANKSLPRLRSSSGGSRTTATSDGDGDGLLSATSHLQGSSLSSFSGSPSPTGFGTTYASSSRIPFSQSQGGNVSANPIPLHHGYSHGHQTSLSSSNSAHTIPNSSYVNPLNTLMNSAGTGPNDLGTIYSRLVDTVLISPQAPTSSTTSRSIALSAFRSHPTSIPSKAYHLHFESTTLETERWIVGWRLVHIMAALSLVCFLILLDGSIMVTALPRITDEFHSLPDIGWYGAAYQLGRYVLSNIMSSGPVTNKSLAALSFNPSRERYMSSPHRR